MAKSCQRKRRSVSLLWVLALAVGPLCFGAVAVAVPTEASPYHSLGIFARALAHIEMSYVEVSDSEALVYGAIRGMVETLDPHSTFMDPEEYRILSSDTEGRFGGVGIEINVRDGWLTVVSVFDSGPAARAGVRPGDRFLSIGDRSARDMRIDEAVRLMRGELGTTVMARLRREGQEQAIEVELTREVIAVRAVEARLIPDRIAYVRLRSFQETTTSELRAALDLCASEAAAGGGIVGVVLDLRQNPGGLLDEAVLVSDEFLSEGVIVSTRGRGDRLLEEARARSGGTRPDWPMVVVVDEFTASAAEIVAGALQDHHRAAIVGTRTFGKGSVQNIIELSDGSALKLTIARYYTPSGRSIQARGIDPDVVVEQLNFEGGDTGDSEAFREESLEGHLPGESPAPPGSTEGARGAVRTGPVRDGRPGEPFPDDYQAFMAVQTLRALIAARR